MLHEIMGIVSYFSSYKISNNIILKFLILLFKTNLSSKLIFEKYNKFKFKLSR